MSFYEFFIQHNIPIRAEDHAGNLFNKMFPDCSIAKKYGCDRAKSANINVLAPERTQNIFNYLNSDPFAIEIDSTHDVDSKVHPIIIIYFDIEKISNLLASNLILERNWQEH